MSFQTDTIKKYEDQGWTVVKTIRLNKSGYPDLFCFRKGITMFIEVKEGKDTLKPLQKLRIKQLRDDGFNAFCLHDTKGVIYDGKEDWTTESLF